MLLGKRILVTRPVYQTDHFVNHLKSLGAAPVLFPTTRIAPDQDQQIGLREELERLDQYHWIIFTSQNAVNLFWEEFQKSDGNIDDLNNLKIAAIGPTTRQALNNYGLSVEAMPEKFVGEEIVNTLGNIEGNHVLLPRAEGAREELVKALLKSKAIVCEISLYKSVTNSPNPQAWKELEKGVDFVTFTSASTVSGFFDLLGIRAKTYLSQPITACIGPITANALEQFGIKAQIVAASYTTKGLVEAMVAFSSGNDRKATQ
ncbi:MAG: uroporphyrinogen-III synthase [Anaerolineaceae bacterium]|nr:uroporphyrinogen-III synthase [Anaerolineaceae bacterium]